MQFLARLVHAEPGTRVVEVTARREGNTLGRALGEAATAEVAEERALQRLRQRLGSPAAAAVAAPIPARPELPSPAPPEAAAETVPEPPPADAPPQPVPPPAEEPPADPEDWSAELTRIDLQLRRIGWQRDQEATFLERAFGHPSRSRITTYRDLIAYLELLQGLAEGSDPAQAPVPLRRAELLGQCDQLLGQLGWNAGQGRQFLERHFALTSRQQLSDAQLLQFNMLLEESLLQPGGNPPPSGGGQAEGG
ncbi:hypothetical protein [Cyanobium sp. CH-040]|uniref:hypothetical protein n=1 Tax=Cyanobium sp. CH-040 TaxID=2823708 RepID=UPI0020CE13C6|nr:hypothetical protein [Cyanobium sp. CH-040]MCP9927591.1 hypothetical protein [Cyanobium sp. CH-040]